MSNLRHTDYYGQFSLEDQILHNVVSYLKYGFLEIGAFYNITRNKTDHEGNVLSKLKEVNFPGISGRTVFQTLKNDLVWETGVTYSYTPPANGSIIPISGIYVNNTFYSTGTNVAGKSWHIDYPRGLVTFSGPIPTGTVEMEYTVRAVNIYTSDDTEYRKMIGYFTDPTYRQTLGSGIDTINPMVRNYMPCICTHISAYRSNPVEIGSQNRMISANIDFDIFSTTAADRKRITDAVYLLENFSFQTFDRNTAPFTFTSSGTLSSSAKTWPELVATYPNGKARFYEDARVLKPFNTQVPISNASVRLSCEFPVRFTH